MIHLTQLQVWWSLQLASPIFSLQKTEKFLRIQFIACGNISLSSNLFFHFSWHQWSTQWLLCSPRKEKNTSAKTSNPKYNSTWSSSSVFTALSSDISAKKFAKNSKSTQSCRKFNSFKIDMIKVPNLISLWSNHQLHWRNMIRKERRNKLQVTKWKTKRNGWKINKANLWKSMEW